VAHTALAFPELVEAPKNIPNLAHNVMLPNNNCTQQYPSMQSTSQLVEVISSSAWNSHTTSTPLHQQQQLPALKNTILSNTPLPAATTTSTGMFRVPTVRAMIDAEYTQRLIMKQQQNQEGGGGDGMLLCPKLEPSSIALSPDHHHHLAAAKPAMKQ
jgi:hypothetical protein